MNTLVQSICVVRAKPRIAGPRRRVRGTATVECAIALPLLVLILMGVMEVGRLVEVHQVIAAAGAVGGRQASLGTQSNAQVRQAVLDYLATAGIATPNATVTVNDLTTPGVDAAHAAQMDVMEIFVSVPAKDVSWLASSFFVDPNQAVGGYSRWISARGQVYPTQITAPPGY